jgi:hypothetical protein
MKSRDVAELYAQLPLGTLIEIVNDRLPNIPKASKGAVFTLETPKPKPEPEAEPPTTTVAATEPEAPVEPPPAAKPVEKPVRVRKALKEQPHFGRSA